MSNFILRYAIIVAVFVGLTNANNQHCQMIKSPSKSFKRGIKSLVKMESLYPGFGSPEFLKYLLDPEHLDDLCPSWNKSTSSHRKSPLLRIEPIPPILAFLKDFFEEFNIKGATILVHRSELEDQRKQIKDIVMFCQDILRIGCSVNVVTNDVFAPVVTQATLTKSNFAILVLSDASKLDNALHQHEIRGDIQARQFWLIKSTDPEVSLRNLELRLDSNVFIYNWQEDETLILDEAYRVMMGMSMKMNPVGVWHRESGLLLTKVPFWERRQNLQGIQLIGGVMEDPPYDYITEDGNGEISVHGLIIDIWKYFQERSNFTTKYVRSIDNKWGASVGNGSFNGLIGMCQRGEIDAGIMSFTQSYFRSQVADHTMALGYFSSALYYKNTQTGINWSMYQGPFRSKTWFACALSMIACGLTLTLTVRHGLRCQQDKMDQETFTGQAIIQLMVNASSNQSTIDMPSKGSSRIAFCIMYTLGLMIWAGYAAVLTSVLASQVTIVPFTNLDDMVRNTHYNIVTVPSSSYEDRFKHGSPIQKEIYATRMSWAPSVASAFHRMATEPNFAALWTKSRLKSLTNGSCDFEQIPGYGVHRPWTIYLKKNYPFTQLFNYHIANMRESGVLDKIEATWWEEGRSQNCNQLGASEALGFEKVFTPFLMLFLVACGCFLIVFGEICYKKIQIMYDERQKTLDLKRAILQVKLSGPEDKNGIRHNSYSHEEHYKYTYKHYLD